MKNISSARQTHAVSNLAVLATLILATVMLAGCGGKKMSGTYSGNASPFGKITFTSGGRAELSMISGQTMEATYTVDGDKVKFTMGGQTMVYTIDKNGCLVSGTGPIAEMMDPLCKQ